MHNLKRPTPVPARTEDSEKFAFCTACNNISASAHHVCTWCGSSEVEFLTLREISARLREAILEQRQPSVADAIPETRFRLSF